MVLLLLNLGVFAGFLFIVWQLYVHSRCAIILARFFEYSRFVNLRKCVQFNFKWKTHQQIYLCLYTMCLGHMPIGNLVRKHRFSLLSSNIQCFADVSQSQLERNKRNHNRIKAAFSKIHSLTLNSASCKCFDVRTMGKARAHEANLRITHFGHNFFWFT